MSIFSDHVLKLLSDYKRLLRRYISNEERERAIITLGIKRKSLKLDNDVILYNKAYRVVQDLEYWIKKLNHTATEHSGIDEFYQHIKNYLTQYHLEKGEVIHVTQKVSCALVQAIQLISTPNLSDDDNASKLDDCIESIIKLGSKDQKAMLAKAVNKQQEESNLYFFSPLLDSFMKNYGECLVGLD